MARPQNRELGKDNPRRTPCSRQPSQRILSAQDLWAWYDVSWQSWAGGCEHLLCPRVRSNVTGGLLGGADSDVPQSSLTRLRSRLETSKDASQTLPIGSQDTGTSLRPGLKSKVTAKGPSLSALAQTSMLRSSRTPLTQLPVGKSAGQDSKTPSTASLSSRFKSNGPSLSSLAQSSLSQTTSRTPLSSLAVNRSTTSRSAALQASTPLAAGSRTPLAGPPPSSRAETSERAGSKSLRMNFGRSQQQPLSNAKRLTALKLSPGAAKSIAPPPPNNPLIAPPSAFAVALFEKFEGTPPPTIDDFTFDLFWTGANTKFAFDTPSPDDKSAKAQSQRGKGARKAKWEQPTPAQMQTQTQTPTPPSGKSPTRPNTSTTTEDDDTASEILEDSTEENDELLRFDMAAMNLGKPAPQEPEEPVVKAAPSRAKNATKQAELTPQSTPVSSPQVSSIKTSPIKAGKRIDVLEEYKKRSAEKKSLNLVVIGHVDAGKSTLMGHLLYLLGKVNEKTMRKYERDSQKLGKSSFAYAWVLDETDEERNRGITMDIAMTNFETEHRRFTLMDAPGHRDFIPNMISGAAQADVAILVVDATRGEFEAGFESNGQTKEHALLVRSLGVQQMAVAINKLDVENWSQDRFDEIRNKLGSFLNQAGFRRDKLSFIPCSGLTSENLLKRSDSILPWYDGPTLIEQIDAFEGPPRLLEKPLRISVTDFFKGGIGSTGGITIAGRVEAGTVQIGEQIVVVPGGHHVPVKAIENNNELTKWAAAGDSVLMTLSGLDLINLTTGAILCSPSHPVPITSHFVARIVVFDVKVPITRGFPVILHRQSSNEPASVVKLVAILDKSSGEVTKRNPRHLPKQTTAIVEIRLTNRAIPLETFKDNKELGRVALRNGGQTVAAGVVAEILS